MEHALTSFSLGLLATTSPCVLPLYPGFLAYLSGQAEPGSGRLRYLLGLFVLGGVLSMMLALGAVIAALSVSIGRALALVIPLADGLILCLGILLLLDRNPFTGLRQVQVRGLRRPLVNAYVYGLLYGPIALPCSGPLVVAIFAVSLTVGDAISQLWVFLWFGLGLGVPLLALSLASGAMQRGLTRLFAAHGHAINRAGGVLLVGVAVFDVAQNWEMLRLFYT
jgi:cytochrome c-type biogenesis protein